MGGADTGGSIGTGDPPSPTAVELPPGVIIEEDDTEVTLDEPTGAGAGDDEPAPFGCGDGELTEDEACDDGNVASGDGCASNCRSLEPGFSCAVQGKSCLPIARCSDGVVAPSEQCDDGNPDDGDGCSARCRIEVGKKCEGAPSICTDALCGDGIAEGAEACDDGNTVPFDGCSADCSKEPNCAGTSCTSECGDGMAIDEECDDANRIDGDGCSAACTVEQGFSCEQISNCEQIGGVCALRIPVIYRDFSELHPDFGSLQCNDLAQGAVAHELGATGKPVSQHRRSVR
jgi:cysteine-rich repeat protein